MAFDRLSSRHLRKNTSKVRWLKARGLKTKTEEYGTRFDRLSDSAYVRETARRKAEELAMKYLSEHPEAMEVCAPN